MPRTSPKTTAHGAAKGPSQRQLRVGEEIRHILAELLMRGEIHDEVLARHTVTVPEVRISPDLRLATAYVMPLGGKDIEAVVEALMRHRKYLRGEISHRLSLKFAPELRFRADESFAEAERVERLLASEAVRRDVEKDEDKDRD